MGLYGRQTGDHEIELEFEDDALFRDASGEVSWPALGVLLDVALGSVTRLKAGPTIRPATVHLIVQMTGASTRGHLATHARFVGESDGTAVPQALTSATITSGDKVIAHASGAFAMFELPPGETQVVLPWPEDVPAAPLRARDLEEHERETLKSCRRAEAAATDEHPFIEHFWSGIPKAAGGKAQLNVKVTPHLGNRVGHAHGGVLLGTAARVANAAAPAGMRLSNISAWFVSPGQPPRMKVRSEVVQQSRNFAVVRTQIIGADRKPVLEVTSQHTAALPR
jgi:acyl-coenzyme A thioesterase PaaI-like protein